MFNNVVTIAAADLEVANPLIEQRADPWILRHSDGYYYFIATVPAFDLIELRRAERISELPQTAARVIWRRHATGIMGAHIWAPELHFIDGKWYIYFAAGEAENPWHIRIYVLENPAANPLDGSWTERGRLATEHDTFSLDATTFEHKGQRYLIWAQRDPEFGGNSSLFIAALETPWSIKPPQVAISHPEYLWESIGFKVNEGPAVLKCNGRIFLTYSASATDCNYCMGMLVAGENADLLDPRSWWKSPTPVFMSSPPNGQYGPGHNSFTVSEDGKTDLLVYHARNYQAIDGDPLENPDRHARIQPILWRQDGFPYFGEPVRDGLLRVADEGR
jgi:GH43 family beta-xylosidase